MNIESMLVGLILAVGWPVLFILSYLIIRRGRNFYIQLKGTVIGKLIVPTVFGWLYGMYMLGIVSTAYMLGVPWYFTVIVAFGTFLIAIIIVYRAMRQYEEEAVELHEFYNKLEKLVEVRTKKLEVAHKKQIEHEKEIQKLKDQFVFIAAHELKTPVTAIKWGINAAIGESGKELDPGVVEYLNNVQESNNRLITLVDDLLNVARIEAGTIKVNPKKMDLSKVINTVIKNMQPIAKNEGIEIDNQSNKQLSVYADIERVNQVLINLISNGIKYNKKGGKITIKSESDGKYVKLHISDNGIGMKKKDMKKLFTKFGRIQTSETREIEGTGLGLFVSKQVIEKMGGKITAESEHGKGSTFTITLPINKNKKKS